MNDLYVQMTSISHLPMEVLVAILKWVVSADLDLRALERCSAVCRTFYLAARSDDIWRRVCANTWASLPLEVEDTWRAYYLSRPRVLLGGVYMCKTTYTREGEKSFIDLKSCKSWHIVNYYRYMRFYPNGRVILVTSADQPSTTVKTVHIHNL